MVGALLHLAKKEPPFSSLRFLALLEYFGGLPGKATEDRISSLVHFGRAQHFCRDTQITLFIVTYCVHAIFPGLEGTIGIRIISNLMIQGCGERGGRLLEFHLPLPAEDCIVNTWKQEATYFILEDFP